MIPISEVIQPMPVKKMSKGDLEFDVSLINISDQKPGDGILDDNFIEISNNLGSDKTILLGCDIIISKLGMSRGYIFICPTSTFPIVGSTEYIPYTFSNKKYGLFYLYLLLHPRMLRAYSHLESGKTPSHKRVNPDELFKD